MLKWVYAIFLCVLSALSVAETLVTEAKILEVTERGMILQVGTEPLAVEDSSTTKVWKSFAPAKRDALTKGDAVAVRIKIDSDPPQLREISDVTTGKWLDDVRKLPQKCTIEKIDSKYMTVKFPDGKTFSYRATDKSDIFLAGRKPGSLSDLTTGMTIYVKGRLLPTLDTFLYEASIEPIAPPASKSNSKSGSSSEPKAPKPTKIAETGKLSGTALSNLSNLKMFDMMYGNTVLHISYTSTTKFTLDGKPCQASDLQRGYKTEVWYKRDKYGRIVASKVEFTSVR